MDLNCVWRVMFAKYIEVVGQQGGVHFLAAYQWTEEEWAAITTLYAEELIPKGWAPFNATELVR